MRGELVGGLDIVREMLQTGGESLKTQLASLEGSAEYKTLHLKSIGEEDDDHNHSHDHAHGQSCGHAH